MPSTEATTEPTSSSITPTRPELLAPAGDRTCLVAAIENGADAVYFGLQGHNARARAANFDAAGLAETMATLHRRGVRGYVTLNTLVFPDELEDVEALVRRVAECGVDAAIVQDLGLARLIRAICPDLEIHASTQMSITSGESMRLAEELGCSRVILARELSLKEIAKVRAESTLPVEVFVHGALCVAYSGQCLTSEALGGRSANRGECAQACRMPYRIVSDGVLQDLDSVQYLLSPQDLAAFDLVPRLIELGVASLKIEGRLKSPEYVANITRHYRQAIDEAVAGRPVAFSPDEVREMELSFSRGFSHGFLDGNDHKVLVRGDYAKKRGVFLGRVESVRGGKVRLNLAAPVKPGDGLVFDGDDSAGVPEQGGRVYEVERPGGGPASEGGLSAGPALLSFGRRDLDTSRLRDGQRVWKTDDPELTRRLRKTFEGTPHRRVRLDVEARAVAGEPLSLVGRTETGFVARAEAEAPLVVADLRVATPDDLRDGLDRLGDTVYRLGEVSATVEGGPMVPKSVLNGLRRDLVARLDALASSPAPRRIAAEPVLPAFRAAIGSGPRGRAQQLSAALPDDGPGRWRKIPSRRAFGQSTPNTRTSSSTPRPSPPRGPARPGDTTALPRHPAHPEAGRGEPVQVPGPAGGRRPPRPQRGWPLLLRRPGHPVRRRLLAQRGQRADRRVPEGPGRPPRDGLPTPTLKRRAARRPDRRRPARLARGRGPSADPDVPHGVL